MISPKISNRHDRLANDVERIVSIQSTPWFSISDLCRWRSTYAGGQRAGRFLEQIPQQLLVMGALAVAKVLLLLNAQALGLYRHARNRKKIHTRLISLFNHESITPETLNRCYLDRWTH